MQRHIAHEIHRLTSALLDNRLDDLGRSRLAELLDSDPEAQELYLSYCDLHIELSEADFTELTFENSCTEVIGLPPGPHDKVAGKSGRSWIRSPRLVVSAIALMLTAWLPIVWLITSRDQSPVVGQVVAEESAVWERDLGHGKSLSPGKLQLEAGKATLLMASGAEVSLTGPAAIELLDAKALRIEAGRVAVRVTDERGIGFRIVTPTADVVDLGTEFGIEVDSTGATEVHVAEGVVVARPTGSTGVVPIMRREAARIDAVPGELASIGFDANRFPSFSPVRQASPTRDDRDRYAPLPSGSRVIFLGDKSTDLETHILLVNQALARLPEAERPELFNAGVSFPLQFWEEQFVDQVESLQPTHAVLEFGPEVIGETGWTNEALQDAVVRLVDRLEASNIEPIVEVRFSLRPDSSAYNAELGRFNAFLRALAAERGYRLADAETYAAADDQGDRLAADQSDRPTFHGFRRMAAAVLAAFGEPDLQVDFSVVPVLLPGVLTEWQYRHLSRDEPRLDDETVRSLDRDDWKQLSLPQPTDPIAKRLHEESHLVSYRDRERGFATSLFDRNARGLVAMTVVDADEAGEVFLNTGAAVLAVWVNGERVTTGAKLGWHAGRHRIPVHLQEGRNEIVVEAGAYFFVSLTSERDWALPVPTALSLENLKRSDET